MNSQIRKSVDKVLRAYGSHETEWRGVAAPGKLRLMFPKHLNCVKGLIQKSQCVKRIVQTRLGS